MRRWILALLLCAGCWGAPGPTEAPPPTTTAVPDEALLSAQIDALASALELSPEQRARALEATRRAWDDAMREAERRASTLEGSLDEETVQALLDARQRALDEEIARGLTPAQKRAFAEFGGRIPGGAE